MILRNSRILKNADLEKNYHNPIIKKLLMDLISELENGWYSLLNLMCFLNKVNIRLRICL